MLGVLRPSSGAWRTRQLCQVAAHLVLYAEFAVEEGGHGAASFVVGRWHVAQGAVHMCTASTLCWPEPRQTARTGMTVPFDAGHLQGSSSVCSHATPPPHPHSSTPPPRHATLITYTSSNLQIRQIRQLTLYSFVHVPAANPAGL